jgi:hypothetical protein
LSTAPARSNWPEGENDMNRFALSAIALVVLSGCAAGPPPTLDHFTGIPRELKEQGVSFGIGRVPGEDALTLQVHFRISATGEDETGPVTEEMWMNAARAAAPAGCVVKSLAPTPEGGRKAAYKC